jgi:hypothetical protein
MMHLHPSSRNPTEVAILVMTLIDLPRPVEAYFAFAELPATERGRHFTITFTYMEGGRLDRLQWWWQVSKAQERAGEAMVRGLRLQAVQRFRQHVETWLINSNRRLTGGDPFPQLEAVAVPISEPQRTVTEGEEKAYVDAVRECGRLAVGG